jgi:hypothetical protein
MLNKSAWFGWMGLLLRWPGLHLRCHGRRRVKGLGVACRPEAVPGEARGGASAGDSARRNRGGTRRGWGGSLGQQQEQWRGWGAATAEHGFKEAAVHMVRKDQGEGEGKG